MVWFGPFGLVWNDDVCIRRARSAHQLDSDILVSAKLDDQPSQTLTDTPGFKPFTLYRFMVFISMVVLKLL